MVKIFVLYRQTITILDVVSGADLGGGGSFIRGGFRGRGFFVLYRQTITILDVVSGADLGGGDFLKAHSAPIYTNFEGKARAGKTRFFGQNFPKKPKNAFFAFFQNFACGAENLAKIGTKHCFGRAGNINLVDQKKVNKIRKLFENPPPWRKT